MKKALCLLTVLAVVVGLFSACNLGESQAKPKVEEKVSIPQEELDSMKEDIQVGSLSGSQAAKVELAMKNYEQKNDEREQFESLQKEIFILFNQGKSVAEIAKTLGIGQGEVQLIVNVCMEDSQ